MFDSEFQQYQRKLTRGRTRNAGTKKLLYGRDGRRRCFACQNHFPAILNSHHIKPVAKNGESWVENLVRLCPNCHALVHWANKRDLETVQERSEHLQRYDITRPQANRISLLSTEEVYVDDLGTIWPRPRLLPEESITHVEIYQIFNWWPKDYAGEN